MKLLGTLADEVNIWGPDDAPAPSRKQLIYVAGPYSADLLPLRRINIARAELVAMALIHLGYCTHTPHRETAQWEILEHEIEGVSYETWMEVDLATMEFCTGICTVPGWPRSKGARREIDRAMAKDMLMLEAKFLFE